MPRAYGRMTQCGRWTVSYSPSPPGRAGPTLLPSRKPGRNPPTAPPLPSPLRIVRRHCVKNAADTPKTPAEKSASAKGVILRRRCVFFVHACGVRGGFCGWVVVGTHTEFESGVCVWTTCVTLLLRRRAWEQFTETEEGGGGHRVDGTQRA